jgi:hypothetical protein
MSFVFVGRGDQSACGRRPVVDIGQRRVGRPSAVVASGSPWNRRSPRLAGPILSAGHLSQ